MFDVGKTYWFKVRGSVKDVSIKGLVIEENQFMVKVKRDDGTEEIIMFSRLLGSNEAKDTNVSYEKVE